MGKSLHQDLVIYLIKLMLVKKVKRLEERLLRNVDPIEAQVYKVYFEKRCELLVLEQNIKSIKDKGGIAKRK